MSEPLSQVEDRLIDAMAESSRGPARNGLFALWLTVRLCAGTLPSNALRPRTQQQRLDRLERRLATLSMPALLRRALPAALRELRAGTPQAAALVFQQLTAPATEALGAAVGEAMTAGTRAVQDALRGAG